MMRRPAFGLFAVGAVAALACAQVPDAAFDRALATWQKERRSSLTGEPDPAATTALAGIAVGELSPAQVERLCREYLPQTASDDLRAQFRARLAAIAKESSEDGAVAAARLSEFHRDDRAGWLDAIAAAAAHPRIAQAFAAGKATSLCLQLYFFRDARALAERGVFAKLTPLVSAAWPPALVRHLLCLQEAASEDAANLDAATRERLRVTTLTVVDCALADEAMRPSERKYLEGRRNTLNGAAARGVLLGHQAPAIDVLWSNREPKAGSFADLRGKIVVVDFWATWCVPCVHAFPHMAELVQRYRGLPVEFVGITSLQGFVAYPRAEAKDKRRVTTEKAADELALLGPWCVDHGVTWTIWVTQQDAFNPDFGVRAIPTIAIVDAAGEVVTNTLTPDGTQVEDRIDELLRAMGKTPPARDVGHGGGGRDK